MRRQTALAAAAAAGMGSMMESTRHSVASGSRMAAGAAVTGSMVESGRKSAALGSFQAAAVVGSAMAAAAAGLVTAMSAHLPNKQDKVVAIYTCVPLRCRSPSTMLFTRAVCSTIHMNMYMRICTSHA